MTPRDELLELAIAAHDRLMQLRKSRELFLAILMLINLENSLLQC